ncbi:hypothetical protein [Blastococcus sp. CCUG 61487]|uniref:hypothetical protein n=1 Tax=Blastococcus sp. CCUG 61487 TaxID=1840703 RepID=UPI0010C0B31D|nr:hypothetical protein [Blastococcus sp. CCUG 61487]TKJ21847.1 hypothetical protein A6V29_06870 [Blastococcus sp. CCUG 61487]
MTSTDQRTAAVLPSPRSGAPDDASGRADPERSRRAARRPDEYWDCLACGWRSRDADEASR